MKTILTVESSELLQNAKQVFGTNLVVGAWFADTCERSFDNQQALKAAARDYAPNGNGISLPTHGMVIFEFLNGRKVAFNTSEWAFVSSVEDHLVNLPL